MDEKEVQQIPHLKWYGIPRLMPFLRPHGKLIIGIIISMVFSSAVDAILPLFQNYAINHYVVGETLDTMPLFIGLYVALLLFQGGVNAWGGYAANTAEVRIDRDVRQACFDHVQTLSFSYFNQNSVGYIHARVISDPSRIGGIISWGLMDFVVSIVYVIAIFIVMFSLSPSLGVLLLIVVPFITLATYYFQNKMRASNRKVREWNSRITGNYNEGITGAKTIKSLVIKKKIQKDFENDTTSMRSAAIKAGWYRAIFQSTTLFLSSFALAMVLWRGGRMNRDGLILIGSLSVFMNYATSISMYIDGIVGTLSSLVNSQVNIERITRLLETESDVSDSPEVIEKYGDTFHPKRENWEPLEGHIAFHDVTFRYPDGDDNVLEHFNLDVPKGKMVAIVGETGAGKSTLVNLVCRFYEPTDGSVTIDNKDVRERSQLWLHSHIGYVLQSPHLFSGTVRENLLYGNPNATQEQIETAVRRVSADRVIARMEHGYDSQVGEGGDLLSTGEKQLISFARALLADPQILILDEATSSIDTLTERAIQNAISEVTAGRTSFVIAHRLSTIRNADTILVMRDGKIVERGTHTELMHEKGYYHQLYTQQLMQENTDAAMGPNE